MILQVEELAQARAVEADHHVLADGDDGDGHLAGLTDQLVAGVGVGRDVQVAEGDAV
jgi:hypothetical protein